MPTKLLYSAAILVSVLSPSAALADVNAIGRMDTDSQSSEAQILKPVTFTKVRIEDKFWAPRLETNRKISLPHSLAMLEKSGNIIDLELAAAGKREGYQGPRFIDSDLYKAIEAISYSLASKPDPELEKRVDDIIAKIAAAQLPDGYLNTYIQVVEPDMRWKNLRDNHELYCAGHLFEAAVAHHAATGKRSLLDVAIKFADNIDSVFGTAPGKRMGYPGHEEIELALFKLWRVTGEQRYYDLAKFFLESRGRGFFATEHGTSPKNYKGEYWQDNVPLRNHKKIVGHAVRAVYLLSGATDYAASINDPELMAMLNRVWANTTGANMYVTGGIGSSAENEGFTHDFDLPNLTAYQETCASVAMIMWNHRMGLLHRDGKYADFMERALYNGFLSGVSLDGTKYFYVNPLESKGDHHRKEWYGCACCPPNVTRTLAQLGAYAYATSPGTLWVNLYIGGAVEADLGDRSLKMRVETDYPWNGRVVLRPEITTPSEFQVCLRIPQWADRQPKVAVNGQSVTDFSANTGFLSLKRLWNPGDSLQLDLPMDIKRVAANPRVTANHGRLAIQRGPLVYCLEQVDNSSVDLSAVALARDAKLTEKEEPTLLGGVVTLQGEGLQLSENGLWKGALYSNAPGETPVQLKAIPYHVWDNRTAGKMVVWIPTSPPVPAIRGLEGEAKVSMSFEGKPGSSSGANDGSQPTSSSQLPPGNCHWWPHKGSKEWVQYTWDQPKLIGSTRLYWFDDTGRGQCRVPKSWSLEYKDGDTWKPVDLTAGNYDTDVDQWVEVQFEPVSTSEMRLVVEMQKDFSAGIHEWQLFGDETTTPDVAKN